MYFRKSSIRISSMFSPRAVAERNERIIIVGRMTAYDEDKAWLYGEFQATDKAAGDTFAAPRLQLGDQRYTPIHARTVAFAELATEFDDNNSNPLFFGFRLWEHPESSLFEYERFQ